jgi:hypothetical protein
MIQNIFRHLFSVFERVSVAKIQTENGGQKIKLKKSF